MTASGKGKLLKKSRKAIIQYMYYTKERFEDTSPILITVPVDAAMKITPFRTLVKPAIKHYKMSMDFKTPYGVV